MKNPSRFTRTRLLSHLRIPAAITLIAAGVVTAIAAVGGTRVSVGSPTTPFSQNKQNEPAIAVDANHPTVLVAGANDNIDMEACNAGDPTTCPFTPGVGGQGVYFSFDGGATWSQPTYTGYTARTCLGPAPCAPSTPPTLAGPSNAGIGPIGTLPGYVEAGLVSGSDPAVAFGPKPGANGTFSWANGSRLYYVNLASNFPQPAKNQETFNGPFAVAVSRLDGPANGGLTPAIVANQANWMAPVIASKQSSTTFSDKEQAWADNAATSPFFGNVYVCYAQFRSNGNHQNANSPIPLTVLVSRDGGTTWSSNQLVPAGTSPKSNNASGFGISGCTVRTDSNGVAYVFGERFAAGPPLPTHSEHVMFKSTDGGKSWSKSASVQQVVDPCFFIDPVIGRCVEDGIAGARNDLAASPSVDIANGAPTGAGATNEIVDAWADGAAGLNNEHVLVSHSTNGGATWSTPTAIETAGDRGYYAAPALSPDGRDLYVVYNAFTTPFRNDTTSLRSLVGVFKHADIPAGGGAPGIFTEFNRSTPGDPRGSSQNNPPVAEFLGDYVYAAATNNYGTAVWNDVRNAADCPAMDAWRSFLRTGGAPVPRPAPQTDCPPAFGNSDIFGVSIADPSNP
jgi:BNR/Asp-box repeat